MGKKIPLGLIAEYIKKNYNGKLIHFKSLGKGWHGSAYEIKTIVKNKIKTLIIRSKNKINFSHDYISDSASSFILNHNHSKIIPQHIKSIDVIASYNNKSFISLGKSTDFFQVLEKANGVEYFKDLKRLLTLTIKPEDKTKALILSNYLVSLHKKKIDIAKENTISMYKRHLRDCICHGEMLMGVLDTYPEKVKFTTNSQITTIIKKCIDIREKIKHRYERLCVVHGDFHPGNILFQNKKKFILLDASRQIYGEPSDDLTSMAINYIWFMIMANKKFSLNFTALLETFWNNYIKKTGDFEINKIAPLFFAFRGIVVAHPLFYKNQSDGTRKKIINFVNMVLDDEWFDIRKIYDYVS